MGVNLIYFGEYTCVCIMLYSLNLHNVCVSHSDVSDSLGPYGL